MMDERRSGKFTFQSEKDIIAFFSGMLPKDEVVQIVKNTKKEFKKRKESNWREVKLEKLKKCELNLLAIVKSMGEKRL